VNQVLKGLTALVLMLVFIQAGWAAAPVLSPKPQFIQLLAGSGPLGKVTVEYDSAARSPQAQALFLSVAKELPRNQVPYEGYVLKSDGTGVLIVVKDKTGEMYARQTLDQLRQADGTYVYATIVDWPRQTWRGLHVLDSGPASLPQLKALLALLAKNRCNLLVYEIDYNYAFASHP
jgi:hypothetical protein